MNRYLHRPVEPPAFDSRQTVAELVEKLGHTSFQARNLARAADIWSRMLRSRVTIFFGLAGAMVPAGMRKLMVHLIERRMIDCLVSTGANLFHDLHETLGRPHFQGTPYANDRELARANVDRIYDVFVSEGEISRSDEFITAFTNTLDDSRPMTTREYFHRLGLYLQDHAVEEGILTSAARAGVPVYCPAFGDSVYGMAVAAGRVKGENNLQFDIIRDVIEMVRITIDSPATGVIYIGGGTPKNYIQQSEVASYIFQTKLEGHSYAIQITTDAPYWGGLSGCTFEEAQSWKKIAPRAKSVTVYADATIALPVIVAAVTEKQETAIRKRRPPAFDFERERVIV